MSIEEDKDTNTYDLSDHNLLQISFIIKEVTAYYNKQNTVLSMKEENCKKYISEVETKLTQSTNKIMISTSWMTSYRKLQVSSSKKLHKKGPQRMDRKLNQYGSQAA